MHLAERSIDPKAQNDPSSTPEDEPLSHVLDSLAGDGFGGQFRSIEGGAVLCLTCRRDFAALDTAADQVTRIEGASDPGEMSMVVPLRCPRCGAAGTLILRYGPEAGAADSDVLEAMSRAPMEGTGGVSSPGRERGFAL